MAFFAVCLDQSKGTETIFYIVSWKQIRDAMYIFRLEQERKAFHIGEIFQTLFKVNGILRKLFIMVKIRALLKEFERFERSL